MQANYTVLANYYDKFTHNDCDYTSWSQYLYRVAQQHGVREVCDIACGTGKMTALLAKRFVTVGVDASEQMLTVARSKCRALFVRQDMRALRLPHSADMAVCVNDGVNYLKPNELEDFFRVVHGNVRQGAPFVFDLSTPYKLREVVGNNVFFVDNDEETLLWSNKLKDNCVEMYLALFTAEGDVYRRSDEKHVQYMHAEEDVLRGLKNAGFALREITADYGKPLSPKDLRRTYFALKN